MKTVKFISIALAGALLVLSACRKESSKEPSPTDQVTDACGNTYQVVKIDKQCWMAENLRCNKYDTQSEAYNASWLTNNTIPTPEGVVDTPYCTDASDKNNWNSDSKTRYGVDLTDAQVEKLGYLYNWAAAVGIANGKEQATAFSVNRQGICPNGWHVPSKAEWQTLYDYIYNEKSLKSNTVGKYMKTTSGWYNGVFDYKPGLDIYGFAVLPAGNASGNIVSNVGYSAYFHTSTPKEVGNSDAYGLSLYYNYDYLNNNHGDKAYGRSVRCVKD